MALTLQDALKQVLADAIDAEINTGAGTAELQFMTAGNVEVATCPLANPAFGNSNATGTISVSGTPQDTNATGNASPVTKFRIFDRDATFLIEGTVSTSGADINISNTTINAGETVTLTSFSITVP